MDNLTRTSSYGSRKEKGALYWLDLQTLKFKMFQGGLGLDHTAGTQTLLSPSIPESGGLSRGSQELRRFLGISSALPHPVFSLKNTTSE